MITLGTGIGGGLMVHGSLHRGANGMAGEFGHMQVVPDGRPCECGRRGCWEQYCSGRALARAAEEEGSELSGPALTTAAYEGDLVATSAYDQVAHWLGVGAANLIAAFDPRSSSSVAVSPPPESCCSSPPGWRWREPGRRRLPRPAAAAAVPSSVRWPVWSVSPTSPGPPAGSGASVGGGELHRELFEEEPDVGDDAAGL